MEQQHRHRRNSSNLFDPNNQGLSTYDLTYVTAGNNKKKTEELKNDSESFDNRDAA